MDKGERGARPHTGRMYVVPRKHHFWVQWIIHSFQKRDYPAEWHRVKTSTHPKWRQRQEDVKQARQEWHPTEDFACFNRRQRTSFQNIFRPSLFSALFNEIFYHKSLASTARTSHFLKQFVSSANRTCHFAMRKTCRRPFSIIIARHQLLPLKQDFCTSVVSFRA